MPSAIPILPIVAAATVLTACGSAAGPDHQDDGGSETPGDPELKILSGTGVVDTVTAPAPPIEVSVSNSEGAPTANVEVRFETGAGSPFDPYGVHLGEWRHFDIDTTGADGRAGMSVMLGTVVGPSIITVSVPSLELSSIIEYSTLAGRAASVVLSPVDTAMYVGATVELHASAADRFDNPVSTQPTYSVSPNLTETDGAINAIAVGRGEIVASVDDALDTAHVSVVPNGMIVAGYFPGDIEYVHALVTLELDGSDYRTVYTHPSPNQHEWGPSWSPDGGQIAFSGPADMIHVTDLDGPVTALTPGWIDQRWPQFTRAGDWIYFAGYHSDDGHRVRRVPPIGGTVELISEIGEPSDGSALTIGVTPAPDGIRLAVSMAEAHKLIILDMSANTQVEYDLIPFTPRWSPTDDVIAYVGAGWRGLFTVRADGTDLRTLIPDSRPVRPGLGWSPDGEWLIVRTPLNLTLVNAASGLELPLAFTTQLTQPDWRP